MTAVVSQFDIEMVYLERLRTRTRALMIKGSSLFSDRLEVRHIAPVIVRS